MKIQKNKIYTLLITLIIIFLSILLWNNLHIGYQPNGIIGDYSINNYSSLNDPIKYLTLILLPSFVFLICKIYIEKKQWSNLYIFFRNEKKIEREKKYTLDIFFFIFIILILLEFFSLDFSYHKLDIFHSGQRLNSAFKSFFDNSLWSGTYITSGIFIEIINVKYIWKLFDFQSIGLVRFSEIILILITKFLLLFLSLKISKTINVQEKVRLFFFTILFFILVDFIDYDINSADLIESREILNLILLILGINFISSDNSKFKYSFILLGVLSVLSFFWSVDRAIIFNLIAICILLYFVINKNYGSVFYILVIITISWLIMAFILQDEFTFFLSNTKSVLKEISDIHGIIHPQLFSEDSNSSRATKTILVILFSVLFSLNLIIKNDIQKQNSNIKIFLILLSIFAFLSYIYALGRSDGGHIRQAFGYPLLFIVILILSAIFQYLDKVNFSLKIKFIEYYLLIFIIIFSAYKMHFNFSNLKNYKINFNDYIYAKDKEFLEKSDLEFVLQASKILKNENCIDLYTYDSPLLYLLKKPSCSRYSFLWSLGSENNQKKFVNGLVNTKAIITNGKTDDWGQIPFNLKYPILDKYINDNFTNEISIGSRKIKFKD